jgi:aminoglycoside 3-N-acetyltransferase
MRSYSETELREALSLCGIARGQIVLVHSSLVHLGRLEGSNARTLAERHYGVLRELIGPQGTVVVPAFTFAFCRGEPFAPLTSRSLGMGSFSEYVRTLPDACRSPHPMQSVAAVGPAAERICKCETRSSFEKGGPFAALIDLDAVGLLLGAAMQSVSLVHLAEERCAVPYRYWKEFTAPYGAPPKNRTFAMYVRDLDLDPTLDLSCIERELKVQNALCESALGAGHVKAFRVKDFIQLTIGRLKANPSWLLREKVK